MQNVGVQRVIGLPGEFRLHQAAECFWSQGAVHEPFLVKHGFDCPQCRLGLQGEEVGRAEGGEGGLGLQAQVGIARVERGVEGVEPQPGVVEGLTGLIGMNIGGQVAAAAEIARLGIENGRAERALAVPTGQPGIRVGEVIKAGAEDGQPAVQPVLAIRERGQEQLRNVGSDLVARGETSKQ